MPDSGPVLGPPPAASVGDAGAPAQVPLDLVAPKENPDRGDIVEMEEPTQEATTAAEGCVLEKDHHPC